jgi:CheY-like chemotaxis protein
MAQDIHFPKTSSTPLAGLNILVVEDSPINLKITNQTLQSLGANVIETRNGEESVIAMSNALDAVLMDIEMPIMDGLTAAAIIRKNPHYDHIPIIAITAHDIEDKKPYLQAGINDHITKPLEPETLLKILSANIPAIYGNPAAGTIDFTEGIASVGGDQIFFSEILNDFCKLHSNEGEQLTRLLNQKKFSEIRKRAHRLKGVAETIRAHEFAGTAKQLEELTNNDQLDQHKIKTTIQQITQCIADVLETIDKHTPRSQP